MWRRFENSTIFSGILSTFALTVTPSLSLNDCQACEPARRGSPPSHGSRPNHNFSTSLCLNRGCGWRGRNTVVIGDARCWLSFGTRVCSCLTSSLIGCAITGWRSTNDSSCRFTIRITVNESGPR